MVIATKIVDIYSLSLCAGRTIVTMRSSCALVISKGAYASLSCQNKEYTLSPSCALFISKGASYILDCTNDGEVLVVNFEGSIEYGPVFQKKLSSADKIFCIFDSLCNIGLSEYKKMEYFYALCSEVFGNPSDKTAERLSFVFDYINEHFCEELTNDILANMASLSNIHFRRLFKIQYGISPHEYILSLRIDKAKRLLRERSYSVEEISKECGFSSLYYFSGAFKKAVGVSPSEFVKKLEI